MQQPPFLRLNDWVGFSKASGHAFAWVAMTVFDSDMNERKTF